MPSQSLPSDVAALLPRFHEWAASQPRIHRLVLFGSRISGTPRPDSDLDVAVWVTPLPGTDLDTIAHEHDQWIAEISMFCSWPIHLKGVFADTIQTRAYAARGVLVYERSP